MLRVFKSRFLRILSFTLCLALVPACERARAAAVPVTEPELEPVTLTLFTDEVLLFMEHPQLVAGESARFLAHFSVLADGAPVRAGRLTLEADAASGSPLRFTVGAPKRDGLFTPEGVFPTAGRYSARLILESDQASARIELGELVVHSDLTGAAMASGSAGEAEPPDSVPFLLEQQWKIGLRLQQARVRTLVARVPAPARAVTPQGLAGVVIPPLAGRLSASEERGLPRAGERVTAGEVLGYVEPPLGAAELAQLRALELEFDLRALEVERRLADAVARSSFAARQRERMERLQGQGLRTQLDLEEAEQELLRAQSEEKAAGAAHAALERLHGERGPAGGGLRLALIAPIAGTVVEARGTLGEFVQSEDELFRIVDESTLWIEASVSEFDLGRLGASLAAELVLDALPDQRLDLATLGRLVFSGGPVDPVSRTALVRFELPNPGVRLRAGMAGTIQLGTSRIQAVAIPEDAIVYERGRPSAYVMLTGELFQKRALSLGIRDGEYVEVLEGVVDGERVTTHGAYAVQMSSLSPAAFGPGHAH